MADNDGQPSWARFANFTGITSQEENDVRFQQREEGRRVNRAGGASTMQSGSHRVSDTPRRWKHGKNIRF